MDKKFEIDIKRLILEILYKSWLIIIAAVLVAGGSYAYSKTALTPRYTASALLYVNNYTDKVQDQISKMSSSDVATSQALVQTYLTFLRSNKVLNGVSEQLGGQYSSGEISSMMSAAALDETEVFQIQVTNENPEEAARIVNVIADAAPNVITNYIEGSSVKVVDYAEVPTYRSYPVYRKYIMLGGVAGGGIAAIIITLLFLFNSKISSEEDVDKLFMVSVIGKIPNFNQKYNGKGYYKGYEYKTRTVKGVK